MVYTQQEIDEKLKILYKNIKTDPEVNKQIRNLLQILSACECGQELIMKMPRYTYFETEDAAKKYERGSAATYSLERDSILLSDKIITNEEEMKKAAISLAHEMRHAIQYEDGLLEFETPFVTKKHVLSKINEMETKLQDILLSVDLLDERALPAESQFYLSEYKRYLEAKNTDETAKQLARDSVVKAYWTGLTDMPKKHSVVSMAFRRDICFWNNTYDMQSLRGHWNPLTLVFRFISKLFKVKNKENEISDCEIKKAFDNKRREIFAESRQQEEKSTTKTPEEILKTYVKNMGVSLPFDYFFKMQRKRSTVGDYFVLNTDAKGRKKSELILLPISCVIRSYYYKQKDKCIIKQEEFFLTGYHRKTEILQKSMTEEAKKKSLFTLLNEKARN